MMKTVIKFFVLAIFISFGLNANAQHGQMKKGERADKMLDKMKQSLNLDEQQSAKIDVLADNHKKALKELYQNEELSRKELKESVKKENDLYNQNIENILNDEQKATWNDLKKRKEEITEKRKERRQNRMEDEKMGKPMKKVDDNDDEK